MVLLTIRPNCVKIIRSLLYAVALTSTTVSYYIIERSMKWHLTLV